MVGQNRADGEPPVHRRHNFNPRPREGGDCIGEHAGRHLNDISIHAPREGGDSFISTSSAPTF